MRNNLLKLGFGSVLRSVTPYFLVFVMIVATGIAGAHAKDGQSQRYSLKIKQGVSLKQVLEQITTKTGYTFFYKTKEINVGSVVSDRSFSDMTIDAILQKLLREKSLRYEIDGKRIHLYPKDTETDKPAQPKQETGFFIEGTVSDPAGETIIGANIVIEGTTTGTTTDVNGKFKLKIKKGDVLVVSYVGFKSQKILVGNQSVFDITLEEDKELLEEVVVVGYGVQKKVDLTGSVSVVKAEDISKQPVMQVSQALTGAVPGLTALQTSGKPGSDGAQLRVRGVGSISASSTPLVLIDGVAGNINGLDPNDIESFSVLKDAGAAAIYGSRASNGVILITTKRAKAGETRVEYNMYSGFQSPTNLVDPVDAATYFKHIGNEDRYNEYMNDLNRDNRDLFPDTDWVDLLFSEAGTMQYHNISVSGGTDKLRTKASIGFQDQDGNIANHNFKRYQGRLNADYTVSDKLQVSMDLNFRRSDGTEPSGGNGVKSAYHRGSIEPYMWSNGHYADSELGGNPVASVREGGLKTSQGNYFRALLKAVYEPIKDLRLMAMYAPEHNETLYEKTNRPFGLYSRPDSDDNILYGGSPRGEMKVENESRRSFVENFTATASYNKSLNRHEIGGMIGTEFIKYKSQYFKASRFGYEVDFPVLNTGNPDNDTNGGSKDHNALLSYFGRLNYSYDSRYLFTVNLRLDGSSRFAEDNRWGVFPSVSAGWNITNESFFPKDIPLNRLKLRGSWGQLGNQNIDGDKIRNKNFPYASVIEIEGARYVNDAVLQGAAQKQLANKEISWETGETLNLGLDFGLFDDRLDGSLEYYVRKTENLLGEQKISATIGLNSPVANVFNMENKGWDLSLSWRDKIGEIGYRIGGNFALVKNQVTDLNGVQFIKGSNSILQVGEPISSIYAYEATGIFNSQEEIDGAPAQFGTLEPGDIRYKDQLTVDTDGDGVFDQADGVINTDDRTIVGHNFPSKTFSFNFGVDYKGFDFSVDFQGVAGRDVLLTNSLIVPYLNGRGLNEWQLENSWTPENPNALLPAIKVYSNGSNSAQVNSKHVFDGSYLRVRNLTLGYTVPKTWLEKTFLSSVRIYASGQNLFTFSDMPDGVDPLVPNGTQGDFYPVVKTYTFGLRAAF
ncbi:SusC/RagA family TonB-linked outer membrane protein (plasmid) [Fulvitalea axinellae]|uniref:SusC/RagA family TonB-linked outer membrane protein n=1 Tax=Fulvitalea axinellae TaxID=1182444 RepID=A0AAU9DH29_9BACT|nr:SusC/RagA family TonB-linked outer membrane protein [Fulvitalea axinellae]